MKKLATGLAVVTLTIGLAACGGGSGPEGAVNDFISALKDKDAGKACALIAPESKKKLDELQQGSCEDTMKKSFETPGAEAGLENTDAKVKESKVDGDNATVTLESKGETNDVKVVKVNGDWKIDLFGTVAP